MGVVNITSLTDLQARIGEGGRVVVDFSADSWCIPCQRFSPHYKRAAELGGNGVAFLKVDVDTLPEAASHFKIMSVPTVLLFEDGERVREIEARTAPALLREIGY